MGTLFHEGDERSLRARTEGLLEVERPRFPGRVCPERTRPSPCPPLREEGRPRTIRDGKAREKESDETTTETEREGKPLKKSKY